MRVGPAEGGDVHLDLQRVRDALPLPKHKVPLLLAQTEKKVKVQEEEGGHGDKVLMPAVT